MSVVKCLVVKSCKGYVDVFKLFSNLISNLKMDKPSFIMVIWIFSVLGIMMLSIILDPSNGFQFLIWLCLGLFLPSILAPVYGAVYDCLIDENLESGVV